jgi:hypothetical protein
VLEQYLSVKSDIIAQIINHIRLLILYFKNIKFNNDDIIIIMYNLFYFHNVLEWIP